MNIENFREQLISYHPDIKKLQEQGLNEAFFLESKRSISIEPKGHPLNQDSLNPIFDMIELYHVKHIEIASISFNSHTVDFENYIKFGKYEQDDLAINIESQQIVLLENDSSHVMSYVAENQEKFMDSLLLIARLSLENMTLDFDEIDARACSSAIRTSKLAGGENYLNFHKTVMGCFG